MFRYLVLEPAMHRRPALAWLRFWQLLHDRTNGAFNELFVKFSRLWRPPVPTPAFSMLTQSEHHSVVNVLKNDGCAVLPFKVPATDIDAMHAFVFSTPTYAMQNNLPINVHENCIPTDQAIYSWRIDDIIRNATIQNFVLKGPFWSIAQDYLGCRPQLSTISLWLNPCFKGKNEQFVYHYDNDGPKFLKFFIYLTNMDIGTGAHYFIKGTHGPQKPKQFSRSKRYAENELLDHYDKSNEFVASGPAGMILAEDTMGFHRGSTMEHGYRLMLQLQYSVIDIPTEYDLSKSYTPVRIPGLDADITKIHRKFWRRDE